VNGSWTLKVEDAAGGETGVVLGSTIYCGYELP